MYHGPATEGSEDGMAEPMKVPYEETAEDYAARIRELVESDRVTGARKLILEALEKFPDHPALIPWQKALSRAKLVRFGGPLDRDRTPEYRWLETEGPQYRGEWVAVLGDQLVAHSQDARRFRAMLDKAHPDFPPLVVWIPDR